jgi:hypothetical protein
MTIAEALRTEGRAEERAESLIDQYITRFGDIGDRERELIVSISGEAPLRAALREIVRPEATPESVIAKLRLR